MRCLPRLAINVCSGGLVVEDKIVVEDWSHVDR